MGDGCSQLLSGRHGPHVLVEDVAEPVLSEADRHHLERVLRLLPGDALTVGDGAGRWRTCRFGPLPEPIGEVIVTEAPTPLITVGFAVIRNGRTELVVQKLTELGIDRIVPFVADRSVLRWDEAKAARRVGRWRRIAREAVMQCRRLWIPEVADLASFHEIDEIDHDGAVLAVPGARPLDRDHNTVLIGPEGGWSETELGSLTDHVGLGCQVLRTETAAIAAATLLAARRSGHLPR